MMFSVEAFSGDWGGSLVVATVLAVALCIVVALLPAALLLVGKLPGKVGDASASALNFLVLAVGDVMVYQRNPRNAFAAREKIRQDLHWLTDRTDKTVVAAHSLGSLLSIDVLSETKEPKVKFLATFGSPIKLLKLRRNHFLDRLDQVDRGTSWANFYDPLDFIGGPVDNLPDFPYNVKVDNGRSVLGAHGGYPDNAEQFQDALYRLIIFNDDNDPGTTDGNLAAPDTRAIPMENAPDNTSATSDDKARVEDSKLKKAFNARGCRSFNGTAFMALSLPAALAGAYLLYRNGWAQRVAQLIKGQNFIPNSVRDFVTAAVNNPDERQRVAGTLLICLGTTAVVAAFLLWIGHLLLMQYEGRAEESVAAGKHPGRNNFRVYLTGIWLALSLPIPSALEFYWSDLPHILTLLSMPLLVMAAMVAWICHVRSFRPLDLKPGAEKGGSGRARMVDAALGQVFNEIKQQSRRQAPPKASRPRFAMPLRR
ncbi:hypothetical protein E5206_10950 [Arthrobacter sp. PAMC25564]|uniref:hypothetical protein n=1 Tax=Arthrobacter sp. PAMC25564 TaxID=2565366 RepID=UPI0010A22E83|nr:hypothetical protein [Arthrobacter sp. PAMC25564]QCB97375.1 hypothetical protein E5206_10950 [Arthrobacter sp. PAMC25564]